MRRAIAAPPLLPGFSVVRPLGTGGFADVFLYEQDLPRRVVAIKVMSPEAVTPDVLRAFTAEADILARVSAHPSIVTIHQAATAPDGRPYFVMEYCPDTMAARYRRGPLLVAEVLDTGVRMGGALETAHRAGLLHRDIKPSNVLVTSLAQPVLADFGIAAALSVPGRSAVAMSVPWSAPEVLQETTTGTVPSEIWGLAATLYTLLAGRTPFESADREQNSRDRLARRVMAARVPPLERDDVPPRLAAALQTAMAKDPARRYETVHAFADELRWVQYELGIAPTNLEVASAAWASAGRPLDLGDDRPRVSVASTVATATGTASRRETRERLRAEQIEVDRDGLAVTPPRRGAALVPALIGAGIATVVVVGVVLVLVARGLL